MLRRKAWGLGESHFTVYQIGPPPWSTSATLPVGVTSRLARAYASPRRPPALGALGMGSRRVHSSPAPSWLEGTVLLVEASAEGLATVANGSFIPQSPRGKIANI